MPSLLNQPVAVNYNKVFTSSNFSGRELTFLVLYAWEDFYAGDPELSALGAGFTDRNTGGYNKLWSESGSRYEIAVNAIGSVAELFFLGEPKPHDTPTGGLQPEETFVFAIATDTRNNWDYNEGDMDDEIDEAHEVTSLFNALVDALGHNNFNIYKMTAIGDNFAINP